MNKLIVAALAALISISSFAQDQAARDAKVESLFNDIKKISKGALGLNSYQTPSKRVPVMQNGVVVGPPDGTLLTVAFRNEKAQQLAQLGFYVGNRYGSNYWELNNAYLATPQEKAAVAFNLNPNALMIIKEAKDMAYGMAKHQMLELFYIQNSPDSSLTKSYFQRGVADDGHEMKYFRLMAGYLAYNVQNTNDYLVLVEFQKKSNLLPGKKTISLSTIRQLVANISASFDKYLSAAKAAEFRQLRNSIHNGMSKDVVSQLAEFKSENRNQISSGDKASYENLEAMIKTYYTIDKETLNVLLPAVKTELPEAAGLIASLQNSGNSLSALVQLSELAVSARKKFETTRNIDLTHLILRIQDFIQAEAGKAQGTSVNDLSTQAIALLNLSYATGFMTEARKNELADGLRASPEASLPMISRALSEGVVLLETVFQAELRDWKLVSKSAASFIDEGIRSSALITLDATLTALKKHYPTGGNANADFSIENTGVGYGYLKFIPRDQTDQLTPTLTFKMIPVFESLPLDLGVVAGVITEEPQTPLSHVNIKSKNRGTPNVFIKKASADPRIKPLLDRKALVRFELKDGAMILREATEAEAQAFWSARNANKPIIKLRADLNEKRIRPTSELGFNDVISVGAKAANYAEATHVLPKAIRPGFAIPFYYYREFIQSNKFNDQLTLEQYMTQLVNDPRVKTDRQFLIDALTALQTRMKAGRHGR